MKSSRSEIERVIPLLRQVARALVDRHRADSADDLVHEALDDVVKGERVWAVAEIETRLMSRLVAANRLRVRMEADERPRLSGLSARGEGAARAGSVATSTRGAGQGLDGLALGDREALVLAVLARMDYHRIADVLGIPVATVVARLTLARDGLGTTLWSKPPGQTGAPPRLAGHHLRLVKS